MVSSTCGSAKRGDVVSQCALPLCCSEDARAHLKGMCEMSIGQLAVLETSSKPDQKQRQGLLAAAKGMNDGRRVKASES